MKKKLAILVPTADRETTIKNWLYETVEDAKEYDIDLIIYDSSNSDITKNISEEYIKKGYSNVRYCKYLGVFDGVSLDHKLISAYERFAEEYEYIWIIRDGLIPKINTFYAKLMEYIGLKYPCIIIDALYRNYFIEKETIYKGCEKNCPKLLEEQAHRLQTLGMLIFSSDFAGKLINEVPLNENVYSLWQMAAPLYYYDSHNIDIVFYVGDTFTFNTQYYKGHFWQGGEKIFQQWGVRWCRVIANLPDSYNEAKNKVLKIYTVDFHPFAPEVIMDLRAYGELNKQIVHKYRKYILKTSDTPMWFINFVANTPKIFWKKALNNKKRLFYKLLCCIYMIMIEKIPVEGRIDLW